MAGMTPEGRVKKVVKEILKEYGAYSFMPVQNGMGAPALDFHCIHRGVGFCIETKAPGKKPTKRQLHTMEAVAAAGGKNFVIDGEVGYKQLREWLTLVYLATGADKYVPDG
jgi:hypothetical protein